MKIKFALLTAALVILLCSCGLFQKKSEQSPDAQSEGAADEQSVEPAYKISIILPNEREQKWLRSGEYLMERLEGWGYDAELHYTGDNAEYQAIIINDSVASETDCIIIAAVDSYSEAIREAVDNARFHRIPVIAYDRLIMNTSGVDIFVAFDPYLSGRMCGQYIEAALGAGPANLELFMGSMADASAQYFYYGAMDVLKPHIDAGRFSVPSGLIDFERTAVSGQQEAVEEAGFRLRSFYTGENRINAVLAVDDGTAMGVIEALEGAGYGSDGGFPTLTGMGCVRENILKLLEGKQSMSLFADERLIADKLAEAADYLVHATFPPETDKTTFDNGNGIVPSLLLQPVVLDKSNYKDLLIGGNYFSYTDVNP